MPFEGACLVSGWYGEEEGHERVPMYPWQSPPQQVSLGRSAVTHPFLLGTQLVALFQQGPHWAGMVLQLPRLLWGCRLAQPLHSQFQASQI